MKKIHATTCPEKFQIFILSANAHFKMTDALIIDNVPHYFYLIETEGKSGGLKFATRKNFYIVCTSKNNEEIIDAQKIHTGRGIKTLYKDSAVYSKSENAINGYNSEYGRALRKALGLFDKVVSEYKEEVKAREMKKILFKKILESNAGIFIERKRRLI